MSIRKINFLSPLEKSISQKLKKLVTKGWNYHKKYTCIITVPIGEAEFKIFGPKKNL